MNPYLVIPGGTHKWWHWLQQPYLDAGNKVRNKMLHRNIRLPKGNSIAFLEQATWKAWITVIIQKQASSLTGRLSLQRHVRSLICLDKFYFRQERDGTLLAAGYFVPFTRKVNGSGIFNLILSDRRSSFCVFVALEYNILSLHIWSSKGRKSTAYDIVHIL